jgi:hypothetical protein
MPPKLYKFSGDARVEKNVACMLKLTINNTFGVESTPSNLQCKILNKIIIENSSVLNFVPDMGSSRKKS